MPAQDEITVKLGGGGGIEEEWVKQKFRVKSII